MDNHAVDDGTHHGVVNSHATDDHSGSPRAGGTVYWITPAGYTYPVDPDLAPLLPRTTASAATPDPDPPPF